MKLRDLLSGFSPDDRWFSCEFFPPKTEKGMENLLGRAKRLVDLGAKFVSVTWGAGGSSARESVGLAKRLQAELGSKIPVVLHMTCTNMSRELLDATLKEIGAPDSGIDNILALRGDRPRSDYTETRSNAEFKWAIDLVRYIHKAYPGRFSIGVAAYPEGFTDSPTSPQDITTDLKYLDEKVAAGADFIMTQLFYDADKYISFIDRLRAQSELLARIPVLPGLMPVVSYNTFLRSAELSHATIPDSVRDELKNIDTQDDEQVKAWGVGLLVRIVETISERNISGGFHFFTLNLEKSLAQIVQRTGLSADPRDLDTEEATWDDFTNGRYTDPSSAAFGQIDGYGPVVHGADPSGEPHPSWGPLKTPQDISKLFVRQITNDVPVTPFSDLPLSAETSLIQEELIDVNMSGIWTIASQPAAYDIKSTDKILGWGPPDGRVSQHAFVELLMTPNDWESLKARLASSDNKEFVYYAASEHSPIESNVDRSHRNVVTWGIWESSNKPVESTMITYESFTAWRDEVYSVLRGWQQLYPSSSAEHVLLGESASERVLVTLISTSTDDRALWTLLLEKKSSS